MSESEPGEPTVDSLIEGSNRYPDSDRELAAHYAPVIKFDSREPFLPLVAGYTVFREDADSPSFPRRIRLDGSGRPASLAIEYAIWWDWDIVHLYELEHVWVYADRGGQVVRAEASWHGSLNDMSVNGSLPLTGDRLTLLSEPGKHAFAPVRDWFDARASEIRSLCTEHAGRGGVLVTPLFDGIIKSKSRRTDELARKYLREHAFEPSMDFGLVYPSLSEKLVAWPKLFEWIPRRVDWLLAGLERAQESGY